MKVNLKFVGFYSDGVDSTVTFCSGYSPVHNEHTWYFAVILL